MKKLLLLLSHYKLYSHRKYQSKYLQYKTVYTVTRIITLSNLLAPNILELSLWLYLGPNILDSSITLWVKDMMS